jgi:hypothetical protein
MRRPVLVPCLAVAALVAGAADVRAQAPPPHPARLTYLRSPGAVACPDQHLFELMIEGQNGGMNPFVKEAPDRIEVSFRLTKRGYVGRATVYDAQEQVHGSQEWTGRTCTDVAENISVLVSSWVAPLELLAKPPPAPQCPPVPSAPVAVPLACPPAAPEPDDDMGPLPPPLEVPKPTKPPPEKAPLSFRIGSGVWVDWISTDRGSVGFTLDASVRYLWGSVQVELRGDPPLGSTPVADYGPVRFARVTGALLACGHLDPLVACLKGQVGGMLFPGTAPSQPAQFYAASGVRLGLEFPIAPSRFILHVDGELLPTIDPASFGRAKGTAFQVAGWNGGIGLTALFSLGKR